MASLSISLPEDLEALIEARVRSGAYADAGDYVRALVLNDLAGQEEDWMTDEIGAAIDEGEASGYSVRTLEQIFAEAKAKFLSR